jgi:hypothetical protein
MRRLTILVGASLLGATTALVPSPASAAAGDFGNTCVATTAPTNTTLVMTAGAPANTIPASAPATGVVTKATFSMPVVPTTFPQTIKILRASGAPNQYRTIAQSASVPVGSGTQSFSVRLPVVSGDLLGVYGGVTGTLACNTASAADTLASFAGDVAVGATQTFTPIASAAIPLVATVEPDVDRDGFGDISQDQCPQSASFQVACPVVVLDTFAAAAGGSITVVVATDNKAKVKITGSATVNGTKITMKSRARAVRPGVLGRFTVKLPKSLRDALAALPSRKFIKVKLVATSTDVVGRTTKDKTSVKLRGTR